MPNPYKEVEHNVLLIIVVCMLMLAGTVLLGGAF